MKTACRVACVLTLWSATPTAQAPARIADLLQAVDILAHSPLIGRPFRDGKRELVIGRDGHGHVALHSYVPDVDTVFVLACRSLRESGFKHAA